MQNFPFPSSITETALPRDDIYSFGLSILYIEYFFDETQMKELDPCFASINKDDFCFKEHKKLLRSCMAHEGVVWDILQDIFELDPAKNSDIDVFISKFDEAQKKLQGTKEDEDDLLEAVENVTVYIPPTFE